GGPVGDFELLLCHGTVCVVGKIRDLILQLSKSSIYSTKPRVISMLTYLDSTMTPRNAVMNYLLLHHLLMNIYVKILVGDGKIEWIILSMTHWILYVNIRPMII
ncbi:hypothetical protein FD815_29910, partial [Klebsiella pneumoniae]|nr:hypothetical protein [Klebsiella pneumoniae]MBQ5043089.1 hypothetical protein [Klebsiella pneumoniae]